MKRKPARRKVQARPVRRVAKAPPVKAEEFPIVGIGASAGGLEAFTQLLRDLPRQTGMAFVLVQHLAPEHHSMLTELLSRATKIPVAEVQDGMRVEPDHIYVIPPNTNMAIYNGVLRLMPRRGAPPEHMPIDSFLASLAADRKSNAIGVILSGSATDGTLGLKAIKSEGGITFAQKQESAKYDSMPRSAIASGFVDFVLPPGEIAKKLARIGRHPYLRHNLAVEAEDLSLAGDHEVGEILALIRKATGDDFTHYKKRTIQRRLKRRMVLKNVDTLAQYLRMVGQDRNELLALYQDFLINVTGFFRTPEAFDGLKKKAFPKLLQDRKSDVPVRVWVPGCSSGEEAYSIAIALLEFIDKSRKNIPIQIFATDISDSCIEKARAGKYSDDITSEVSPERLKRFFVKITGGYQVIKSIRDVCVFARQNVFRDPPFSRMDLISCRNLLIYLDPLLQKKVMPVFHYALKPGGCLLLGSAESAPGHLFTPVDKKTKIYAKKSGAMRPDLGLAIKEYPADPGEAKARSAAPVLFDAQKEVERLLLKSYTPAGVVINGDMDILHFHGRTGRYLEPAPGSATLSLARMAREGLSAGVRTLVQAARKRGVPVRQDHVPVWSNAEKQEVSVEVIPIGGNSSAAANFLVLFRDVPEIPTKKTGKQKTERRGGKSEAQEITRLRRDLAQSRNRLEGIIQDYEAANEELRAANEEIQSSNEELQSTNEELETAKEELQSTNEELVTLNEELQNRNYELNALNSDLMNLLANVNVPMVMLRSDLRIRRISPPAEKLLNLIPGDLGRPITDLKIGIEAPGLEQTIAEAIHEVSAKEREVQDRQGRWYSLRIRPYKTVDNKIDGVVMTLVDIDQVKVREVKSRILAETLADSARDCMLVLDDQLRIKAASPSFFRTFQVSAEETEGRLLYELGDGQWNIPRLRELLETAVRADTEVRDYEVEHDFHKLGRRVIRLGASPIRLDPSGPALILLAMGDVTAHREAAAAEPERDRLIETISDAMFMCDLEDRIKYWSRAAEDLFGFRGAEAAGHKATDLLKTKAFQPLEKIRDSVMRNQHWQGELLQTRKDGTVIRVFSHRILRKDSSGQPLGWVAVSRPVPEAPPGTRKK